MEGEEQPQEKPISIVDEARAIRDEIRAEREKLEAANKEAKEIAANNLLSGGVGGHQKQEAPKEETPKEYATRVMRGDFNNNAEEE